MLDEPRTYRHSESELRTQVFLGVLGIAMLGGVAWFETQYLPLVALGAVGIMFSAWRAGRLKTVISEDAISTQGIFGEKSLRWNQISRASGRNNEIKLIDRDGDVTLSPSIELPGYEEIIEIIGAKRPDLFSASRHPVFKKNMEYAVILPLVALLPIGLGAFIWQQADEFGAIPFLIFLVIGLAVLAFSFTAPQQARIEGGSLRIKYLWREKTFSAAEIQSVELTHQNSRNSKNYYVRLKQSNQTAPKLFGLAPSMPVVYLVLKQWHEKSRRRG